MREIIKRAKEGDKEAKLFIIDKYRPLIYKASQNIFVSGFEDEDLRQVAFESILKAIEKYNLDSPVGFSAYVKSAVENNFKYLISGRAKDNYMKSLNEIHGEGMEFGELIPMDFDLEEYALDKDIKCVLKRAISNLSLEEKEMLYYFFEKSHGGVMEYSKIKGISYKRACKFKSSLINKLKEYIV